MNKRLSSNGRPPSNAAGKRFHIFVWHKAHMQLMCTFYIYTHYVLIERTAATQLLPHPPFPHPNYSVGPLDPSARPFAMTMRHFSHMRLHFCIFACTRFVREQMAVHTLHLGKCCVLESSQAHGICIASVNKGAPNERAELKRRVERRITNERVMRVRQQRRLIQIKNVN